MDVEPTLAMPGANVPVDPSSAPAVEVHVGEDSAVYVELGVPGPASNDTTPTAVEEEDIRPMAEGLDGQPAEDPDIEITRVGVEVLK